MSEYSIKEHSEELVSYLLGQKTFHEIESFPMVMAFFHNLNMRDDVWKNKGKIKKKIKELEQWIGIFENEVDWVRHNLRMAKQDFRIYERRDHNEGKV